MLFKRKPVSIRGLRTKRPKRLGERIAQYSRRALIGHETAKKGTDKFRFLGWAAITGATGSAIDSTPYIRKLLNQEPHTFVEALRQAAIVAATTTTATAAIGAMQIVYGKIKAGRNLKKLKPLVWGRSAVAKKVIRRLSAAGEVDRELLKKILRWGEEKE